MICRSRRLNTAGSEGRRAIGANKLASNGGESNGNAVFLAAGECATQKGLNLWIK
jgi:hypothetical protein